MLDEVRFLIRSWQTCIVGELEWLANLHWANWYWLEMGPDLTRPEHTFDLQLIRCRPAFDWGTFLTRPEEIFFDSKEKN